MMNAVPIAYVVNTGHPYPPWGPGWCEASADDAHAAHHAGKLAAWFPLHHYVDQMIETGLHRFFCYDTAAGQHIGALRYTGDMTSSVNVMGQTVTDASVDISSGTSSADGTVYQQGGAGGNEPIPQPNSACSQWVPDTSNAQAVSIANSISNSGTPVKFASKHTYDQTIGGTLYRFVMWSGDCRGDGGTYNCVSVFRCVPPSGGAAPAAAGSTSTTSSTGVLVALAAAVAVAVGGWFAFKK